MSSTSTMVEKLQKFFKYCLSKLKNSHPQIHPSSPHSSSSSPLKRILSGCKHPKTPSFSIARGGNERNHDVTNDDNDDAATLSDVDQFLFENFKSLFLGDDEPYTTENTNNNNNNTKIITDDGDSESNHSDLKSRYDQVYPMMSPDLLNDVKSSGSGESVVLLEWSENVYEDFRRSMKGMVDARLRSHGRVDWGFMEELLLCYLNLNEKRSHKFVLSAYVDLINGFRDGSSSPEKMAETAAPVRKPMSVRTFRSGREIGRSEVGM